GRLVRLARGRGGGGDRGRPAVLEPARPGHRRDREPRRRAGWPGRADRPGGQRVPDRRHQLAGPRGPAALQRDRQGPARLRRGGAAGGPAGAAHRPDHHQPGGAGRGTRGGAAARVRGHRRRTRTGAGGGGRPGLPRRRYRGRRAVGVRPGDPADHAADRRRGRRVHGPGQRPVRRPGPPSGAPGARGRSTARGRPTTQRRPTTQGRPTTQRRPTTRGRPTTPGACSPSTERRCRVTPDELLKQMYNDTLVGNGPAVLDLTQAGLEMGLGPETLLYDALIPALEGAGARFERGDCFVPEMLIAGKAMAGALEILRPLLAETGAAAIGTVVMGTVKGDVHDIGKNLVNIMFEGAGFQVIDLGVQVSPEKFVDAVREHQPDILGFSPFLTRTMPMFKANINALQKSGLRDQVIVMVGGAPVTQEYADVVGADGYAADASAAVVRAKELLQQRRAALPA